MIDLIRRHIVILAGVALGYAGYTFYDGGSAKPEAQAKSEMTGIDPAYLAVRDTSIPLVIGSDPYRLDGARANEGAATEGAVAQSGGNSRAASAAAAAGATSGSVAPRLTQTDLMLAFAGALRQVAGETHDLFMGRSPTGAASTAAAARGGTAANASANAGADGGAGTAPGASAADPVQAGFTLLLQSTLDMRGGSTARINGRTVAEGEAMPFLDPADPPVLRRVKGTAVIVRYGERDYVADLLENPLLQVGLPLVAVAEAPASSTSAPAAKPAAKTAAPATGGATGAKAGKKKGTYRVRGSTKKP